MSRKGRKDHYLPQGYLKGFAAPVNADKKAPLFVLQKSTQVWTSRHPAQFGYERGYYDPSRPRVLNEDPEDLFRRFENKYPDLIAELSKCEFADWRLHLDFLLEYAQMIRARSPLFRQQFIAEWSQKRGARVLGVDDTGGQHRISVDSLKLRRFSPPALRDAAIRLCLEEMRKGAAILKTFHWQLRSSEDPHDAFITSDQPLVVAGPHASLPEAIYRFGSYVFFPLSWRACLVGTLDPFALNFRPESSDLQNERKAIRRLYLDTSQRFVVSPHPYSLAGV